MVVSFHIICIAIKVKIIIPRYMFKSVNTPIQKKKGCSMLSGDDDDGFFEV